MASVSLREVSFLRGVRPAVTSRAGSVSVREASVFANPLTFGCGLSLCEGEKHSQYSITSACK